MHHPTDRITHTTAFVTPVVDHWLERKIAQWVHHEGCSDRGNFIPKYHSNLILIFKPDPEPNPNLKPTLMLALHVSVYASKGMFYHKYMKLILYLKLTHFITD